MNTRDCQPMLPVVADPGTDDGTGAVAWEETPESGCARGLFYGLVFVLPFWVTVIAVWLH